MMNVTSLLLGAVLGYVALLVVCLIISVVKHNKQLRHKKYTKDFMKKVESFNFEEDE